jgi:hypothetical protein
MTQAVPAVSRQHAIIDVLAVGGVAVGYLILEALHVPKRWSFLAVGIVLAAYAVYLVRRRTESWHALGFRVDNLRAGLLPIGLTTFVAAVGLVTIGALRGAMVSWRAVLVLLALYPVWALVQQFAFQGLLHQRMRALVRAPALQVLVTAAAFASVHFGNRALMALTFLGGIVWSVLYRRWPNLWLLAGSHTVLAALAYPLVLGDTPLSRV